MYKDHPKIKLSKRKREFEAQSELLSSFIDYYQAPDCVVNIAKPLATKDTYQL